MMPITDAWPRFHWLCFFLAALGFSVTAWADRKSALEETDHLPAVQNRKYQLHHEFMVGGALLPADPYTKGYALNGGYAWHLNETWGLESRFHWVFNDASALRNKLEGNFGIPPARFDKVRMFGTLGAVLKPLYGKFAFLNNQQVYGEAFLSLHAVVAQLEGGGGDANGQAPRGQRLAFGGAPGFGLRGFLTQHLSLRFDFSSMILVSEAGDVHVPVLLMLNFAYTTRSDL